jgi:D-alanyl-D-alanine dipeptidase
MKRIAIFLVLCLLLAGCAGGESVQTEAPAMVPAQIETVPATEPAEVQTEAVTESPTEPPAELPTEAPTEPPEDADLVCVRDYIPMARELLIYATEENFTGQQIYEFYNAYLRYGTVKKLAAVCEELETQGLGILIWDGFRPVSAQAALWEAYPDPLFVSHPVTGTRTHCRGNAVDLTLVDLETGERLLMPTDFDVFSSLADRDYSDCAPEAAANAKLLESIMTKHGFTGYSGEWWHYSDTTSYDVDETFTPV